MMSIHRGLAAAAVLTGVGVGLAGPASAEPPSGTYTATYNGMTQTWTFTPCGAGCVRLDTGAGLPGEMHLQGNTWTVTNDVDGDGVSCTWQFDAVSLAGLSGCGGMTFPMQLTKA